MTNIIYPSIYTKNKKKEGDQTRMGEHLTAKVAAFGNMLVSETRRNFYSNRH